MLPIPDNPDPDLVRQTRRGDRAAFLALVTRHTRAVRAVVEARMPGNSKVDDETVAAWQRIHRTLFVVRDLTWFHLFAVRTTQAHLDAQHLSTDDPGPDAPDWLRRLTLGQREALFFDERAAGHVSFPAIEYLGIAEQAYEARRERGRAIQAKAAEWGQSGLPAAPADDMPARIASRVDAVLGPGQRAGSGRRRLPRLPLPFAFLLAVALAAVATTLLFRPPHDGVSANGLVAVGSSRLGTGSTIDVGVGAHVRRIAAGRLRLELGRVTLVHEGNEPLEVELGGRLFVAGTGRFRLTAGPASCRIDVEQGSGTLREPKRDPKAVTGAATWLVQDDAK